MEFSHRWHDAQYDLRKPHRNGDIENDGFPWASIYRSQFSEAGLGLMFDVDLLTRWNVTAGARYDTSHARNVDYAGAFNVVTGTSENPGAYTQRDVTASGRDGGRSWSVSLSYQAPYAIRPYVTLAEASIVLDANNNMLTNAMIEGGHVGSAQLREIGVKGSLFDERLFFALARFQQARTEVEADDDPALVYAYPTATRARGVEAELKWAPWRDFLVRCTPHIK